MNIKKLYILWVVMCVGVFMQSASAQGYRDLERNVMKATGAGASVVSVVAGAKKHSNRQLYFVSSFEDDEDDLTRKFFEDFFGDMPEEISQARLGSGFIIDSDGYILTNAHIVSETEEIKVILADGREFPATLKGEDDRSDLAVIKIDAEEIIPIKMGDSDKLEVGQFVLALGGSFGISSEHRGCGFMASLGVVSAVSRFLPATAARGGVDSLIQTDAAINPGNSGGPLVDLDGNAVGVNLVVLDRSGRFEGVNFAISINKARQVLDRLVRGEKILYGWLGVSIQDLNKDLRSYFGVKEKDGVIVVKTFVASPAEKAGIKEGDLILAFNSRAVKNTRELINSIAAANVGEAVPVEILRDGKPASLTITVGVRPEDVGRLEAVVDTSSYRGMKVEDLSPETKKEFRIKEQEGVVITEIQNASAADTAGLRVGDVVTRVGNKRIRNKDEYEKAIQDIKGNCLVKTSRGYVVVKEE